MRAVALAVFLVACGPPTRGSDSPLFTIEPRIEWTSQMKYANNYVPAIEAAATASGCNIGDRTATSFQASCGKVDVYCSQKDRVVTRGCEFLVDYGRCKKAWEEIIKVIVPEE